MKVGIFLKSSLHFDISIFIFFHQNSVSFTVAKSLISALLAVPGLLLQQGCGRQSWLLSVPACWAPVLSTLHAMKGKFYSEGFLYNSTPGSQILNVLQLYSFVQQWCYKMLLSWHGGEAASVGELRFSCRIPRQH